MDEKTRTAALEQLEEIGNRIRRIREQHPDSPFAGTMFSLAALTGELQATLTATRTDG